MTRLSSWLSEGWYHLRRWLDMTFFFAAWYGPIDDDSCPMCGQKTASGLDELKVWIHPRSRLREEWGCSMATKTRPKITKTTEKYFTCDICGKELDSGSHRDCGMCGRDVHPSGTHKGCSAYDDDEATICMVCWELGQAHRAVAESFQEKILESYAKWHSKCANHRYDEPKSKGT